MTRRLLIFSSFRSRSRSYQIFVVVVVVVVVSFVCLLSGDEQFMRLYVASEGLDTLYLPYILMSKHLTAVPWRPVLPRKTRQQREG